MTQIVCISRELWDAESSRINNLLNGFPEVELLYFEPAQPIFSKLRRPREGTKVSESTFVFTLPHNIPSGEEAFIRIRQLSRANAACIRRCMQEHSFDNPILWLCCPDAVELVFALTECGGIVYDCDREWPSHYGEWEAALSDKADVVLAASSYLHEHLLQYNDNVALIPNGVDIDLFSQSALSYASAPADLARVFSPIFGFLGTVGDFTQLAPVYHAATTHPDWNFVFVGACSPRNSGYSSLRKLKNVFFLGEKSRASLPRYLAGFDVCFTLMDDREPNPLVLPVQVYQYLSSGKPVVAMSGGRLEAFYADVINFAHFDVEFTTACEAALEENSRQLRAKRIQYGKEASWKARSHLLHQIFEANGFA